MSDVETKALQDLLPANNGARICFGCGADNHHGLRIKSFVKDDVCVCEFTPEAHHTAFPGVLNGGIIASVLDCHGIWTAVADHLQRNGSDVQTEGVAAMFVTRKLAVEYLKPTPMGKLLTATGRVTERGEKSATVALELSDGEKVTAKATVLAVRVAG